MGGSKEVLRGKFIAINYYFNNKISYQQTKFMT